MATQEIKKGKPVDKEVIRKINELNQKGDAQGLWQLFKEYDIDPSSISADVAKNVNPIPAKMLEVLKSVIDQDSEYKKVANENLRNMTDKLFKMLESYNNNPNISEEERAQNTLQIYKQLDEIRDETTRLATTPTSNPNVPLLVIGAICGLAVLGLGGAAFAAITALGSSGAAIAGATGTAIAGAIGAANAKG